MKPLLIRQGTETDVTSIYELGKKWVAEKNTYGLKPYEEDEIRAALKFFFLVAEMKGKIVGFIAGSRRVSDGLAVIPKGEAYLEIDELYVAAAYRGEGIGSELVEKLLELAREKGLKKALVYSASKDVYRVMKFYEEQGFRSWFVQMYREV